MTILYRIYANNGMGGSINYAVPIAETADLNQSVGPLLPLGHYRFGVRSFDPISSLEEFNTQAVVEIRLDQSGIDIGIKPMSPFALSARAMSGGKCQVGWVYPKGIEVTRPKEFRVFLTSPQSSTLQQPVATISYSENRHYFQTMISGLGEGTLYTITVFSVSDNSSTMSDPATTNVLGKTTPPDAVQALTVTSIA